MYINIHFTTISGNNSQQFFYGKGPWGVLSFSLLEINFTETLVLQTDLQLVESLY